MPKVKMTRAEYQQTQEMLRNTGASKERIARLHRMPYFQLIRGLRYWDRRAKQNEVAQ